MPEEKHDLEDDNKNEEIPLSSDEQIENNELYRDDVVKSLQFCVTRTRLRMCHSI